MLAAGSKLRLVVPLLVKLGMAVTFSAIGANVRF